MATEKGQEYLCEVCGTRVVVVEGGEGTLVCCGKPMRIQFRI